MHFLPPIRTTTGIVAYANGFLISHIGNGGIYYLDLTDNSVAEVLAPGSAPRADGLIMDDDGVLYIAQGVGFDHLSVFQMATTDDGKVSGTFLGLLLSEDYDSPTSCDLYNGTLYAVNAAFKRLPPPSTEGEDNLATFTEEFTMVGVDKTSYVDSTDAPTPSPDAATPATDAPAPATDAPTTAPDTSSAQSHFRTASTLLFLIGYFLV